MSTKELIQEQQYSFPYHYLTHEEDGGIFIFRHLFWGLVHYTYISHVIQTILQMEFKTLVDVGCGEGRIIHELEKRGAKGNLIGIDISDKAISFAKVFASRSHFLVHDITAKPLDETADIIVSCEVIEHIEPAATQSYINNIHSSLNHGGTMIITTPTTNVPVNKKHYQHFTSEMFDALLKDKFTDVTYTYLNKVNWYSKVLERTLANRYFISNSKTLNRFVLKQYRKKLLHASRTTGCRIMVKARKT